MNSTQLLIDHKIRITKVRKKIIELLMNSQKPLCSREVIQSINVNCDEATIFRTLKTFKESKLIYVAYFDDNNPYYGLKQNIHSHHVLCTSCGKTKVLQSCCINPMIEAAKEIGFSELGHRVEIFGKCQECIA